MHQIRDLPCKKRRDRVPHLLVLLSTRPLEKVVVREGLEARRLTHSSAKTVADNGFAERAGRSESNAGAGAGRPDEAKCGKKGTGVAGPIIVNLAEIAGFEQPYTFWKAGVGRAGWRGAQDPDYLSSLTVSFLRPMARRREITACPSAVFMRVRKPCVLARRRLFG